MWLCINVHSSGRKFSIARNDSGRGDTGDVKFSIAPSPLLLVPSSNQDLGKVHALVLLVPWRLEQQRKASCLSLAPGIPIWQADKGFAVLLPLLSSLYPKDWALQQSLCFWESSVKSRQRLCPTSRLRADCRKQCCPLPFLLCHPPWPLPCPCYLVKLWGWGFKSQWLIILIIIILFKKLNLSFLYKWSISASWELNCVNVVFC